MWRFKETDTDEVRAIAEATGISMTLSRVLVARGLHSAAEVQRYLNPELDGLHPAAQLPDIGIAVARIRTAIRKREPILIWGHEDLDGMTSVVCLRQTIQDLRGIVGHYIPVKGSERHGIYPARFRELQAQHGYKLVVTVDCGITNVAEIDELRRDGIDVVVTDHHEVLDTLPNAVAIVNPKRPDSSYPFRNLAGVGVALKTAYALAYDALGVSLGEFFSAKPELLTMVAMGTIADRVPLLDENRIFVREGLEAMRRSKLPAVQAVIAAGGMRARDLTVTRFVQDLMPLFASANGNEGVEMLTNPNVEPVREWVKTLERQYSAWRDEARQALDRAEQIMAVTPGLVIIRGAELGLRALGHCAARLKDRLLLPVVVMGKRGGDWVGECRGVEGINLVELLKANARFFVDYGGHAKACGFTIPDDKVVEFTAAAQAYAEANFVGRITETRELVPDAMVNLAEIGDEFRRMVPFGEGNPPPLLLSLSTPLQRRGNRVISPAAPHVVIVDEGATFWESGDYDLLYELDDHLNVHPRTFEAITSPAYERGR